MDVNPNMVLLSLSPQHNPLTPETESYHVVYVNPELIILLPRHLECWENKVSHHAQPMQYSSLKKLLSQNNF